MNDDDHILTLEQTETAIIQIVRHAGTPGIDGDNLYAAVAELEDLHVTAALAKAWDLGLINCGWDGTELVWFAADRADDIVTQRQQEAG